MYNIKVIVNIKNIQFWLFSIKIGQFYVDCTDFATVLKILVTLQKISFNFLERFLENDFSPFLKLNSKTLKNYILNIENSFIKHCTNIIYLIFKKVD